MVRIFTTLNYLLVHSFVFMTKKILTIGKPIKPMLVKESGNDKRRYSDIIKTHYGKTITEIKSDGHRVQIHKNSDLSLFTRNLNRLGYDLYPDIHKQLKMLPEGIYDGELVGLRDGIEGFNAVKNRKRSTLDLDLVKKYPLQVKFFDILQLGREPLINETLTNRREILEDTVDNVSDLQIISSDHDLKERYTYVTEDLGMEGLVCKDPNSYYQPGARNSDWIKLKKFLTLDFVILGVYEGEGKASKQPFAALLLGTKNGNKYETITKVGISNKEKVNEIYKKIKPHMTDTIPSNVSINQSIYKSTYARKIPFAYINPRDSVVVEIDTMNITRSKNWHSCGYSNKDQKAYSLRIPVVNRIRNDKRIFDATTTKQVGELYSE